MPRNPGDSPPKPYFMQNPIYNLSHDDMPKFLERLRAVTDEYGEKFTVAEVGGLDPQQVQMAYTAGNERLSTAYAWDLLVPERPRAKRFQDIFEEWPNDMTQGWPSWAFCNHDAPRTASRWAEKGVDADWPRLFGLLLMSLRGNVFIYQGEELGLPQAEVPFERLQDPEAIANWPHTLGRDGARTPMPWDDTRPMLGFSEVEPWLPVDARHGGLSVRQQKKNPDSVLIFFREIIAVRKASAALRYGEIDFHQAPTDVLAFTRQVADESVCCVFNLGCEEVSWKPHFTGSVDPLAVVGLPREKQGLPDNLPAFSGYICSVRA